MERKPSFERTPFTGLKWRGELPQEFSREDHFKTSVKKISYIKLRPLTGHVHIDNIFRMFSRERCRRYLSEKNLYKPSLEVRSFPDFPEFFSVS